MSSWLVRHSSRRIHNPIKNTSTTYISEVVDCFEPQLFTYENGKSIINEIRRFSSLYLTNVKKIVNVYKPLYKNGTPATGLGDFLRGSYFLYQYCRFADIECEVNLKYHSISTALSNKFNEIDTFYLDNITSSNILNFNHDTGIRLSQQPYIDIIHLFNKYLLECNTDKDGTMYICIKPYPIFVILDDDRIFMKSLFNYNSTCKDEIDNIIKLYKLENKTYHTIHIRTGDDYLIKNESINSSRIINTILEEVNKFITINKTEKILVISDNGQLLHILKDKFDIICLTDKDIRHTGEGTELSLDAILKIMLDFYLLSHSLSVLSVSTYYHGSGFSKWCAETYNIPYISKWIK